MSEGLHRRIGRSIDLIKGKIDAMAETGIDRSVIDFLSGQIVDLRQDLATAPNRSRSPGSPTRSKPSAARSRSFACIR